jgi:hypothetical protein
MPYKVQRGLKSWQFAGCRNNRTIFVGAKAGTPPRSEVIAFEHRQPWNLKLLFGAQ